MKQFTVIWLQQKLLCKHMQEAMDMRFLSNLQLNGVRFTSVRKEANTTQKCKDPSVHPSRQRPNTSTMKTNCPYQAVARKVDDGVGYMLKVLDNNHSHGPVEALSAFPRHRIAAMTLEEQTIVQKMGVLGHSPI